ncbi:MAG: penicillin-binding transpeptidase domain-containing protein [Clostridium fessum]
MSANDAQFLTHLMSKGGRDWYGFRDAGASYTVAGKTGSAEFEAGKETHSWFVGFAPAEQAEGGDLRAGRRVRFRRLRSLRRSQDRCWIGILRNMGSRTKEKGRKAI